MSNDGLVKLVLEGFKKYGKDALGDVWRLTTTRHRGCFGASVLGCTKEKPTAKSSPCICIVNISVVLTKCFRFVARCVVYPAIPTKYLRAREFL